MYMLCMPEKEKEDKIAFISAGSDHSIAISESRENIYSWGLARYGCLATGEI